MTTERGMKPKTIHMILSRKVKYWLESIEDEKLREDLGPCVIVTGGSIASMLLGEQVNDFDIYFTNNEIARRVAVYYVGKFKPKLKDGIEVPLSVWSDKDTGRVRVVAKSAGIASEEGTDVPYQYFEGAKDDAAAEYVSDVIQDPEEMVDLMEETKEAVIGAQKEKDSKKPKYRPVFLSTNAITLSDKVQIILRFTGSSDEIHKNYDFVHCTNYWTKAEGLVLRKEALQALLSRELRYVGSLYPICSLVRIRKFLKRGFTINAGQILKMCLQIAKLDLTDRMVLMDQLTGVDVAYFAELLTKAHDHDPARVDTAYIVELIDRMM